MREIKRKGMGVRPTQLTGNRKNRNRKGVNNVCSCDYHPRLPPLKIGDLRIDFDQFRGL